MRTHPASAAVLFVAATGAGADVLYDTLWITDQLAYDGAHGNANGGFGALGYRTDARLADDFVVDASVYPNGLRLTEVAQDSLAVLGTPPQAGFVLRVYADEGAMPADQPMHEFPVPLQDATVTMFDNDLADLVGMRFELDLGAADVTLAPGTYWLNIQPVDTTPEGDWFYQVWDSDAQIGAHARYRDDYLFWKWVDVGPGIAAMRVEGVAVPASAPIAILLCAGAFWRGRRQR